MTMTMTMTPAPKYFTYRQGREGLRGPEGSKGFWKGPRGPKRFQGVLEGSWKGLGRVLEGSEGSWKGPRGLGRVPGVL